MRCCSRPLTPISNLLQNLIYHRMDFTFQICGIVNIAFGRSCPNKLVISPVNHVNGDGTLHVFPSRGAVSRIIGIGNAVIVVMIVIVIPIAIIKIILVTMIIGVIVICKIRIVVRVAFGTLGCVFKIEHFSSRCRIPSVWLCRVFA